MKTENSESQKEKGWYNSPFYLGLCPCGFFCKDCISMEITHSGWVDGLAEHFLCHTLLGRLIVLWEIVRDTTSNPLKILAMVF